MVLTLTKLRIGYGIHNLKCIMKKTIIINNGSTSKKYALHDDRGDLISVFYEKIPDGYQITQELKSDNPDKENKLESIIDKNTFDNSFSHFLNLLLKENIISFEEDIKNVAFRIVAPGIYFQDHKIINDEYLMKLEEVFEDAKLHLEPVKNEIINVSTRIPQIKMYGISDSAFHKNKLETAKYYGIPNEIAKKLDLYRFGYHGISASYANRVLQKEQPELKKVIFCHLGGGASVTAIKNGKSIDNSMGYSPLEGVIMATRPGNIDANAVLKIMEYKDFDIDEMKNYLYKECGVKGLSGMSSDTRKILEAASNNNYTANLTLDVYAMNIKKYIGSYFAMMGGLDALIFSGTIGERSSDVRKRICENLESLGAVLDLSKNKLQIKGSGNIHTKDSNVRIIVLPTDEDKEMANIFQECF